MVRQSWWTKLSIVVIRLRLHRLEAKADLLTRLATGRPSATARHGRTTYDRFLLWLAIESLSIAVAVIVLCLLLRGVFDAYGPFYPL